MSKSSKQYRILEKDGSYGFISTHRAEKCLSAGYAALVSKGVIQFCTALAASSSVSPPRHKWGPEVTIIPEYACDSGQSGFLRYPQSSELSTGPKYPTLARMGAGL